MTAARKPNRKARRAASPELRARRLERAGNAIAERKALADRLRLALARAVAALDSALREAGGDARADGRRALRRAWENDGPIGALKVCSVLAKADGAHLLPTRIVSTATALVEAASAWIAECPCSDCGDWRAGTHRFQTAEQPTDPPAADPDPEGDHHG